MKLVLMRSGVFSGGWLQVLIYFTVLDVKYCTV